VNPCCRCLGIRQEDHIRGKERIAQPGGIADRDLGIGEANGEGGLHQADVRYRRGGHQLLVGKLPHDCCGQDDDVGRYSPAQFFRHGADRAEFPRNVESGLRLEGRR
jgi:hypothetical protein